MPLYVMQGAATLIGLALLPSLFWYSVERKGITSWFARKENLWLDADGHFGHDHCIHGTNSVFIDWNAHLALS